MKNDNVFNANKARVAVPRGVQQPKEIKPLDCLTPQNPPQVNQSDTEKVSNLSAALAEWVKAGRIDETGQRWGSAAYMPRAYDLSVAALERA